MLIGSQFAKLSGILTYHCQVIPSIKNKDDHVILFSTSLMGNHLLDKAFKILDEAFRA